MAKLFLYFQKTKKQCHMLLKTSLLYVTSGSDNKFEKELKEKYTF